MDEKRFMELFPQPESSEEIWKKNKKYTGTEQEKLDWKDKKLKNQKHIYKEVKTGKWKNCERKTEEKRREEFFAHMKKQIRPQKKWELPEVSEHILWKKKRKRRIVTAYGATAAACLILVIVLPNLSELLKLSEDAQSVILEDDDAIDNVQEKEYEDEKGDNHGALTNQENTEKTEDIEQESPDSISQNDNDMGNEDNSSEEDGETKGNNTQKQQENEKNGEDVLKGFDFAGDNSSNLIDNVDNKEESVKTGNKGSKKSANDKGNISEGKQGANKEILKDKNNNSNISVDPADEDNIAEDVEENDSSISDDIASDIDEPVIDNTEAFSDGAVIQDGVDTATPECVETEDNEVIESVSASSAVDNIEDGTAAESSDVSNSVCSAFDRALTGWWEEENEIQTDSKEDSIPTEEPEDFSTVITGTVKNEITKKEMEKELEAYPYLYYQQNQKWYSSAKKTQSSVEGKELIGSALIFKKKTPDMDNENEQQKVYIYGDKQDLSTIFVRFQIDGKDWYYIYQL